MSLPDEEKAREDIAQRFGDLFVSAERLHNATVEILTRGKLVVRNPTDHGRGVVVLISSMLTKACKTFRAIQLTSEGGLGQDASVLARQLFETTVAVKFILQKDSRLRAAMFGAHEDQRFLVLVEKAVEIGGFETVGTPEMLEKAREKVRAWNEVIPAHAVDSVRRHWSGNHGLEWAAREVDLLSAYTMMYRYTSAFAHGSDASAHFFVTHAEDVPTLKLSPGDDQVRAVLVSSMALMAKIVETVNEVLGLGEEAVVERINTEVRQSRDVV